MTRGGKSGWNRTLPVRSPWTSWAMSRTGSRAWISLSRCLVRPKLSAGHSPQATRSVDHVSVRGARHAGSGSCSRAARSRSPALTISCRRPTRWPHDSGAAAGSCAAPGLALAVDAEQLQAAVRAALAHQETALSRAGASSAALWRAPVGGWVLAKASCGGGTTLSRAPLMSARTVLEALRGFDDGRLVAAAPYVYELVAGLDLEDG